MRARAPSIAARHASRAPVRRTSADSRTGDAEGDARRDVTGGPLLAAGTWKANGPSREVQLTPAARHRLTSQRAGHAG
jgi:hypothetical protein